MSWLDSYDMFAKPVINFNIHGREKVTSRCGLAFSFLMVCLVIYFVVVRLVQIATYNTFNTRNTLGYGEAEGEQVDITNQLSNLAFRAVRFDTD